MARRFSWWRFSAVLLLAGGGVASAALLATPMGAVWVTRIVVSRVVGGGRLSIGSVEGSVLRGVTAQHVSLEQLPGERWRRSRFTAETVEISPLSLIPFRGVPFILHHVRWERMPLADVLLAERMEGWLPGDAVVFDLQASGLAALPAGSRLEVQRLELALPAHWSRLHRIDNGRLRLPYSEPVVLFGTQSGGQLSVQAYAKRLDLEPFLRAVPQQVAGARARGQLSEVHLAVSGPMDVLTVTGTCQIPELALRQVLVEDSSAVLQVLVGGLAGDRVSLTGELTARRGTVTAQSVPIDLQEARLAFTGDPTHPRFTMQGRSAVGGTTISLALEGGPGIRPTVRLSSDPPMPQEALLAMLATGKRWSGAQEALTQGAISSELATDFLDYLFFGGAGNKLARRLGITDLGLTHDADSNRVGAQATLMDRVALGVEIDPTGRPAETPAAGGKGTRQEPAPMPYKVGAAYRITDTTSVSVEGERTVLPSSTQPAASPSPEGQAVSTPKTDDTVLLKVKRRF